MLSSVWWWVSWPAFAEDDEAGSVAIYSHEQQSSNPRGFVLTERDVVMILTSGMRDGRHQVKSYCASIESGASASADSKQRLLSECSSHDKRVSDLNENQFRCRHA